MPKDYFLPPGTRHWADFRSRRGGARTNSPHPRSARRRRSGAGSWTRRASRPRELASWAPGSRPSTGGIRIRVRAETDARGEFVLGSIAPKSEVRVSASSGMGRRVGAPDGLPEPARESRSRSGSRSGRPWPSPAGCSAPTAEPWPMPWSGSRSARPNADHLGRASFSFRWVRGDPDRTRWAVQDAGPAPRRERVSRRGARRRDTNWRRRAGSSPPDVEVPDLRLRRSIGTREVTGRVVDSAGKPVAGAEVFQSGDGPKTNPGR